MRQPVSAITNLAYLIPAILATEWYLSGAFVLLALGSAAFHSVPKDEDWAQSMDEVGMLGVFWGFVGSFSAPIGAYIAFAGFIGTAVKFRHFDSFQWVPILFTVSLIMKANLVGVEALYLLIPFAVALACRKMSEAHSEDSWTHDIGHSFWHVLSAVGFVLFIAL